MGRRSATENFRHLIFPKINMLTDQKLWTTNSSGWDQKGATLQCVACRHAPPNTPQPASDNPPDNILILIITREDIAANPPSAYQILDEPELVGHKSSSGPHTRFTSFRVPALNLLSPPGQGAQVIEQTFGTSGALVAAFSVGIMRTAFEAALSFCKSDHRGGVVPIIQHQSVADKLMDVKMRIEAARALTWKALSTLEREDVSWEAKLEIALEAKIWCSDQAPKAVLECMAAVGMRSYAKDMLFSRLLEDAVVLPLFDGGNVGVRRRQLEKILRRDDYEPWAASY